jgi:hypothetical protein
MNNASGSSESSRVQNIDEAPARRTDHRCEDKKKSLEVSKSRSMTPNERTIQPGDAFEDTALLSLCLKLSNFKPG